MFKEMDEAWDRKDFARLAELEVSMWVDGPGQSKTRIDSSLRERVREMILNTYTTHTTEGRRRSALILLRPRDSRKSRHRR